jgi:acyl carrier protein
VARADGPLAVRELRARLGAVLPDYMVPAEFVFVERLPLLPNGKIDIGSLPASDGASAEPSQPYAAPTNPIESVVADIWSEVLGRRVGVDDEFLELGGDSLLAANMLARVNAACQVELPFSALFDTPTVAALAGVIVEHLTSRLDDDHLSNLLDELERMPQTEAERQVQQPR